MSKIGASAKKEQPVDLSAPLLTIQEVARLCKFGRRSVERHFYDLALKVGKSIRFPTAKVLERVGLAQPSAK